MHVYKTIYPGRKQKRKKKKKKEKKKRKKKKRVVVGCGGWARSDANI